MTVSLEEGEKEEEISKYPSAAAPSRRDKIRSDSVFSQTTKKIKTGGSCHQLLCEGEKKSLNGPAGP